MNPRIELVEMYFVIWNSICLFIGFFINLFFLVLCIYCPNYSWLVYVFALNTRTLWLLVLKNTIFISVFCALFISNSLNSQPAFYTEFNQKACSYNNHMKIKFWENLFEYDNSDQIYRGLTQRL